ncbi:Gfo/Idh/MocA family oxidoreductase [Ruania suaedae]|uniref:Gfo/Idh/MocA family protein n=1 Tax=Ruania suaedae TaxID=2897774 RepID=UPI001E2C9B5D|nr:Gfo/Idh/MocA family oxidoreductase [Ruania suaedae]UFU02896.1 Gfo/Idh/MocA family oxidoreductase [Ruania suaedae]
MNVPATENVPRPEHVPDPAYLAGPPARALPIVVIGAGGIARDAHLPAYRKARMPVAAVVDLDAGRARDLAADYDIPATYERLEDAVAEHGSDAVYDVAVMPDAFESILTALPDGAAVQLQKPLGYTYAEASALVTLCERKQLRAAVNTQLRFAPHVATARRLIADGAIGELIDLEALVRVETPWELFPSVFALERMEMPMHSVHYVDLVRSFVGDPSGVSAVTLPHPHKELASTRSAYLLHYADRPLRVTISTNHDHAYGPAHQEAAVLWHGTEGAIRTELGLLLDYPRGGPDLLEITDGGDWREIEVEGSWFPDAFIGSMGALQRYATGESATLPTSAGDVLRTMAVLEAAHEAGRSGGHPLPGMLPGPQGPSI